MTTAINSEMRPVTYGELIRGNRNFRLAWLGQIVSLTGDWFDLIASAALLETLTGSGLAVGGLFVVRMLAPFAVTPFAGLLADRFNRKLLLVITDALRAVIVLGFLLVRRPEDVWLLYVCTGLQMALSGIYFPARNAILPDIVSQRELGAANALSAVTWSTMLALGAALGGVAAGLFGVYFSFALDAITFVISALLQLAIRYAFTPPDDSGRVTISGAFQQYVEGLRFLRHNVDLLLISLHKGAIALLVTGAFMVLQVSISKRVFVVGVEGTTGLGLMYGAVGVGTGLGPILARRITGDRNRPMRAAMVVGYVITALGLLIVMPLISFEITLFGMFLRGVGMSIGWVFSTQLLLQLVPGRVRGRVFATEFAIQTLGAAAGSAVGGWAVDAVPLSTIIAVMGVLVLIPAALWVAWILVGKVTLAPVADNSMLIPRAPAERIEKPKGAGQ